ncbi:MAG: ABC-F family ATP-binding cassette domain-containing protein [Chloroflexota bacterium]
MFFAEEVNKSFGSLDVLNGVTFIVGKGERVGLVGPNGAGKTTLLRVLAGDEKPDEGNGGFKGGHDSVVGYLRQEAGLESSRTLVEELWTAFPEARNAEIRLKEISSLLEAGADNVDELIDEQAALFEEFEHRDGYRIESRIGRVLDGLGFAPGDSAKRCGEFSGGWQMRVALAKVLVRRPDHMLLDEPTNHLDKAAVNWLSEDLSDYKGSLLIVTHDGEFLDRVATRILELRKGVVDSYVGNYSEYQRVKAERLMAIDKAAGRQERYIEKQERFISRFIAKPGKTSVAQARRHMISKIERIERPQKESEVHISLRAAGRTQNDVLVMEHVGHAYPDGRGGDHVVLLDINLHVQRGQKVVLVGENGSGKSTLLKIAAGFLQPTEGVVRWADLARRGYYDQLQDEALDPDLSPLEEVKQVAPLEDDERLRTVLGQFLFRGDDVFKRISMLSGGERSRVALAKLVLQPTNVLLLDEPTNHLDKTTRRKLIDVLARYDGTIICAAHDPGLLDRVATRVYEVADGECRELIDARRD